MALSDEPKFLNNRGLETLWGKIESLLQSAVEAITTLINGKQDALTFDSTPTANSTNPVTSGGIKTALDRKQDALTFPLAVNKGGTGATDTKAARMNLLSDATVATTDVSDSNYLAFRYASPSNDNGAIYYKSADKLWNYIKGKADSVYQPTITAGTGLAKSGNTINHSNSVTAQTAFLGDENTIPQIKIDAQGHITEYASVESGIRQRTSYFNVGSASTLGTKYHLLRMVTVPKGGNFQAGILELYLSGDSTRNDFYYARVFFNIKNDAASDATTCVHVKNAFVLVGGVSSVNTAQITRTNFIYTWQNDNGDLKLRFYFKSDDGLNQFTCRFYIAPNCDIGNIYTNNNAYGAATGTTVTCSEPTTDQSLFNAWSARNDEDGNSIKNSYLKLTGNATVSGPVQFTGGISGITEMHGLICTRSIHGSPLVANTANTDIPYINFATGKYDNNGNTEVVKNQLLVRTEVSPNITASSGPIYSYNYGWLGNYTNNTYTVLETDGLAGMTGTGHLTLTKLSSAYSIGRYFWIAPSGGDIEVTYNTASGVTVTETFMEGTGAIFVCGSNMYWSKIGGNNKLITERTSYLGDVNAIPRLKYNAFGQIVGTSTASIYGSSATNAIRLGYVQTPSNTNGWFKVGSITHFTGTYQQLHLVFSVAGAHSGNQYHCGILQVSASNADAAGVITSLSATWLCKTLDGASRSRRFADDCIRVTKTETSSSSGATVTIYMNVRNDERTFNFMLLNECTGASVRSNKFTFANSTTAETVAPDATYTSYLRRVSKFSSIVSITDNTEFQQNVNILQTGSGGTYYTLKVPKYGDALIYMSYVPTGAYYLVGIDSAGSVGFADGDECTIIFANDYTVTSHSTLGNFASGFSYSAGKWGRSVKCIYFNSKWYLQAY